MNRPLLGQRAHDLMRVTNYFTGRSEDVSIVAIGSTGPVALHAAAMHGRVTSLTLEGSLVSWMNVVQNPVSVNQLTNVVPGALRMYDLPELAASMAPRPLTIRNPVDAAQRPVAQADLEKAYDVCRAAYAKQQATRNLTLEGAP